MLKTLNIENFKCLNKFEREFGALTLLTGLNAAGKSSVIQCIALLHQSITENEWGRSILLNGSTVELGTMVDVIDRNSGG
jgi:predicted ATPase